MFNPVAVPVGLLLIWRFKAGVKVSHGALKKKNQSHSRGIHTSATLFGREPWIVKWLEEEVNICARVCLVDEHENVLLNTFVRLVLPVTDYRYEITGIKPTDFNDAPSFRRIRAIVKRILGDRLLLVGHDLRHDLGCLNPPELLRDTATYQLLVKTSGVSHKLRFLIEVYLGYKIQDGTSHDPCGDAVAAMRLYKRMRSHKNSGALAHSFDISQLTLRNVDSPQRSCSRVYSHSAPSFHYWCLDSKEASVDDTAQDVYGLSTM